ncbi:hypothetical protein ACDX69_13925 [Lysinibacillus fusiformis]
MTVLQRCDLHSIVRHLGSIEVRKFGEKQVEKERFVMKINDEILDRLGTYFVYHAVYDNYGITFENFVERWIRGILEV